MRFAREAHASLRTKKRDLIEAPYTSNFPGGYMQTVFKILAVGALFALGTSAALAADPAIGTWKLNLAKSTFSPGPAPRSQVRTYAESTHYDRQ